MKKVETSVYIFEIGFSIYFKRSTNLSGPVCFEMFEVIGTFPALRQRF